jgi:hypothetical protein
MSLPEAAVHVGLTQLQRRRGRLRRIAEPSRTRFGNFTGCSAGRHLGPRFLRKGLNMPRVKKTAAAAAVAGEGRFPMKTVAELIVVSRSNLIGRLQNDRRRDRSATAAGRQARGRDQGNYLSDIVHPASSSPIGFVISSARRGRPRRGKRQLLVQQRT